MSQENPTAGDSGASITERLERYLSPASEPPEETKEPAPETDAAPEQAEASDVAKSDAPEEVAQPQLSTADLAKVLGLEESALDVDEDGSVIFKPKIDGKEGTAKLADLLKSYQISGHAENKARAVAEQERALQQRVQEVQQQYSQRLSQAEQLTNIAAQELMQEFQSYDWKALEQTADPGALANLKLRFQERQGKIQNAMQSIHAQRAQMDREHQARREQFVQQEFERLPEFIPEWKDQTIRSKEASEIADWCLKAGYSPEFVKTLNQSTALEVATVRKAMLYDKQQQAKPAIENKVRAAPKLVRPGQAQPTGANEKLNNLKADIRKTGGQGGSVAAYLIAKGLA